MIGARARSLVPWALAALVAACATTGADGEGDRDLPSSGVGPFRKLGGDEVPGVAPFVLDSASAIYREPSALSTRVDGEAEPSVVLYLVARDASGVDGIVRSRARDGRAFYGATGHTGRAPLRVLSPEAAWEGGALSGPAAVTVGDEIWLYYAAKEGIGLARSRDGRTFTRLPGPVLSRDGAPAWETTPPRAPSVARLSDGRFRMLYAAGNAIGEAESADGLSFRRVDPVPETPEVEPVLSPSRLPLPGELRPNEKPPFDTARVSDPEISLRTTPAGRLHVRVLYTGEGAAGATAIGFAGRYGESGVLERQPLAVYAVGKKERAPTMTPLGEGVMLYVQQEKAGGLSGGDGTFAIAGAFAPGTGTLGAPSDYPETP